jgi:hypothetical protein
MVSDETTIVDKDGNVPDDKKNSNSNTNFQEGDDPSKGESDWPGDYNESNDEDDPEATSNDGSKAMMSSPQGGGGEAEATGTAQVKPASPSTSSTSGSESGERTEPEGGTMSIQTVPNPAEGSTATMGASNSLATSGGAEVAASPTSAAVTEGSSYAFPWLYQSIIRSLTKLSRPQCRLCVSSFFRRRLFDIFSNFEQLGLHFLFLDF